MIVINPERADDLDVTERQPTSLVSIALSLLACAALMQALSSGLLMRTMLPVFITVQACGYILAAAAASMQRSAAEADYVVA